MEALNEYLKEFLLEQEIVVTDEVKKKPYGMMFKNGQDSLGKLDEATNEMNLFLMGESHFIFA